MRRFGVWVGVVALAGPALVVAVPEAGWAAATVPSAPRSVRMTPGNGTVTVRWHPPANDGGHPVTQYEVIPYFHNQPIAANFFPAPATSQVIFGLKNGKAYTFKVAAKNSVGLSRLSVRSAEVTVGVPVTQPKPTAVAGKGTATVSWHSPATNNGAAIDSYRVTPLLDGDLQAPKVFKSIQTHEVLSGLAHGHHYTFVVASHNSRGWSADSNESAAIIVK